MDEREEQLRADVKQAYRELGSTPDEIAEKLRQLGIRGSPAKPWSCPIANYLRRKTKASYVSVVAIAEVVRGTPPTKVIVGNPPAVDDFIDAFDNDGAYGNLVSY